VSEANPPDGGTLPTAADARIDRVCGRRWQSFPELRGAPEGYGLRVGDAEGAVARIGPRPEPVRAKLVAATASKAKSKVRAMLQDTLRQMQEEELL
jgi:hypothetical protein